MLTVRETALALTGVWQLAHFDPQGMAFFDKSVEGFWRSFRVAVVVAPAYALLAALHFLETPVEAGLLRLLLVEAIAYVTSWVAFPLAAYYASQMIDRNAEYVGYIVAYNWATILRIGVYLPVTLLATGRVLPGGLGSVLLLLVTLAILIFDWFIARTALRVGGLAASGVVALDVAISLLIRSTADGMVT
jgi:hypothetical protein